MSDTRPGLTMARATAILIAFCVLPAFAHDQAIDGKPLSELVKQLRSENRGLQVRALSEAPAAVRPALVPLMLPLLKSERENDRFVAAQVLGDCGLLARPAVPEPVPLLRDAQIDPVPGILGGLCEPWTEVAYSRGCWQMQAVKNKGCT